MFIERPITFKSTPLNEHYIAKSLRIWLYKLKLFCTIIPNILYDSIDSIDD